MPLYHAPSFSSPHYAVITLSVLQIYQTPSPTWSLYTCCSLGWAIISLSCSSQPLLTFSLSLHVPASEKPALKCFLIQTLDYFHFTLCISFMTFIQIVICYFGECLFNVSPSKSHKDKHHVFFFNQTLNFLF